MSSAGRFVPASLLPFAPVCSAAGLPSSAAAVSGFSSFRAGVVAVVTDDDLSAGFSTGDFGGGGMFVPSVMLPKLRSKAGSSKRELFVPLSTRPGILMCINRRASPVAGRYSFFPGRCVCDSSEEVDRGQWSRVSKKRGLVAIAGKRGLPAFN